MPDLSLRHLGVILLLACSTISVQEGLAQESSKRETITKAGDPQKDPNIIPRLPAAAMATIQMMPGYSLELVAHEPMIKEPSVAAWDGNGRMYVAEMRTYMQDIDGGGKFEPTSRISLLEDSNGDGQMDKHTIFADKLLLPRMILTMHEGIIIRETNTLDLWWLKDTDGDGVSDWKKKVFEGGPRGGNLEHQPSGLMWAMDNRCYVTYTNRRYRWKTDHFVTEPLAGGDGQWGLTQDDEGQVFFSRAGGETPCASFQQNLQYGKLSIPGQFAAGYVECWPIDEIPDVQGGPGRIREDNTLNHFTAGCGQVIFRGDRLPADLYGDYLLAEPVGRLIRRSKVRVEDGVRVLSNAYDKTEFIRTKDANFRPVNLYTGPDGCMYIIDMYRGIIQEGNWVREGSYLRGVVQKYGLDKNIGRGRIYRVRHRDFERGPRPTMLDQTSVQLVEHLSHPNGWWRDEAQKLMVLRGDKAVLPKLHALLHGKTGIAGVHALWTLDGLDSLSDEQILTALDHPNPKLRQAALRIVEPRLTANKPDLLAAIKNLAQDQDPGLARQAILSAAYQKIPGHAALLRAAVKNHPTDRGIAASVRTYFDRQAKAAAHAARIAAERERNVETAASIERGAKHYKMLCFVCHGSDGKGAVIPGAIGQLAPSLVGSPRALGRAERTVRIVLHGMQGPVDGKTYTGVMAPLASNDDAWIADVLTFVRRSWGNKASPITRLEVTRIRKEAGTRKRAWTVEELRQFDPILRDRARWTLRASINQKRVRQSVDGRNNSHWGSIDQQKAGMWFAVEFPYALRVDGLQLKARKASQSPADIQLEVSEDGERWTTVTKQIEAKGKQLKVQFAPQTTRHLRLRLVQPRLAETWTIADFDVFGAFHPRPRGKR